MFIVSRHFMDDKDNSVRKEDVVTDVLCFKTFISK